jgi:acetolactate synthase-1/2/3 large subunit
VAAASQVPGQIATLILPGDVSWQQAGALASPPQRPAPRPVPQGGRIDEVAKVLLSGESTLLILGHRATRGRALELAGRVAAASGARLATQFFSARIERGAGRVPLNRIPYAVAPAMQFLKDFRHIVTVETGEPVAFFSYPDRPSLLKAEGTQVHGLARLDEDGTAALEALLEALGAKGVQPLLQERIEAPMPTGALNPESIARALAAALPDNCIVVDESLTSGRESMGLTIGALPHDMINNMGGSIGYATPVATGAALACPGRRVLCLVGDGSAMYTIQSLWTQAREGLDVTTVVFANNSYAILKSEYANMGAGMPGPRALSMIDIDQPRIDWVAMAASMGVPAVSVTDAESLTRAMADSAREPGPRLIEARL